MGGLVRRPSSVCGVDYLLNCYMCCFHCGFVWFPWAIPPDIFWVFGKKMFCFFLRIFFVFLNMGPYGRGNFKTLLLLQIAAERFQIFLNFLPNGPHKSTFWDFWNFENWNFNDFFFVSVNMGPYESSNFKTLMLVQIAANNFETSPGFFFSMVLTKILFFF